MKPSTQEPVATPGANKPEAPHTPHFDKLRVMKSLQAATFSEDQAGAMVGAIDDAQRPLTIKSDMEKIEFGLHTDIQKMESRIRTDIQKMEYRIRADIRGMESRIRTDIGEMELRLQAEFKKLYWYIPLVIGVTASLLGVFSPS